MQAIFLIGGGRDPQGCQEAFGPFLAAASVGARMKLALILAVEVEAPIADVTAGYLELFETLGIPARDISPVYVSTAKPLRAEQLTACHPTGIFVGGGSTPLYQSSLCVDRSWLEYLRRSGIPYAGFSAGAAIAAQNAVVGGWKVHVGNRDIAVLDPEAGEDLDWVEVRQGLGLVPFAVDVHASQWGTLTRLMQAVNLGWVEEGWAIDEHTVLEVRGEHLHVQGAGHAYHVQRGPAGALSIQLALAGFSG